MDEIGDRELAALKERIGFRESGGDYGAVNKLGYLGKYQFGALRLEDLGYLKKGVSGSGSNAEVLGDPESWSFKGGREAFLADGDAQEAAMDKSLTKDFNRMVKDERLNLKKSGKAAVYGTLAAMHLKGYEGAIPFLTGADPDSADSFGTKAEEYYSFGKGLVNEEPADGDGLQDILESLKTQPLPTDPGLYKALEAQYPYGSPTGGKTPTFNTPAPKKAAVPKEDKPLYSWGHGWGNNPEYAKGIGPRGEVNPARTVNYDEGGVVTLAKYRGK